MVENNYIGRILDRRYKVSQLLAETGMGVVYSGEDLSDNSLVSIKILQSDCWMEQESVKRFFREARATVELRHRNIVKVFDVGLSEEGAPYIVQEYLEGESLSDLLIRVGKLKTIPALGIIEPVLQAIGTMHSKGILHRGITPKNIYMVNQPGLPPTVKLIDFGLAKFMDGGGEKSKLTMVGVTLGDFSYISPEQIRDSSAVDKRSDLYTIGTILYEMLTGKLPFSEQSDNNRLKAKLTEKPIQPGKLARGIPKELNDLIMRALSIRPEERPADAEEMLNIIEHQKGYKDREEKFIKCAQGVKHLTIAGAVLDRSSLPKTAESNKQPNEKKGSDAKLTLQKILASRKGKITLAGTGIGVLIGIVIALSTSKNTLDSPKVTNIVRIPDISAQPPEQLKPTEVQIEVRGLPAGAKIYYDDALIPMNPFRVVLKEVIVSLKVEAEGYEDWATSIVPAEDQVVKVQMAKRAETSLNTEENTANNNASDLVQSELQPKHHYQSEKPQTEKKKSTKNTKQNNQDGFKNIKDGVKIRDEFD